MMEEYVLRGYLLFGLLLHKAVWEVLKRRSGPKVARPTAPSLQLRLVKSVKLGILLCLVAQLFLPEIFPLLTEPEQFRPLGVALFTVGLATALLGRLQLGTNWSDIEDAEIKKRHAVVSAGLYRLIRHPIYTGDLVLLVGFELALNSWLVFGVLALTPIVLRRAMQEEEKLAEVLQGYEEYRLRTKRFIPYIV